MCILCNPMINCGARWAKKCNIAPREAQFIIGLHNFIIGLHNFSSGYAILVPGYKFRGWQFLIPGYTRTVRGRRRLSYVFRKFGDDITSLIQFDSIAWVKIQKLIGEKYRTIEKSKKFGVCESNFRDCKWNHFCPLADELLYEETLYIPFLS